MGVDVYSEADRPMEQLLAIRALMFLFFASAFLRRGGDRGGLALGLLIVQGLVGWTGEMRRAVRGSGTRPLV